MTRDVTTRTGRLQRGEVIDLTPQRALFYVDRGLALHDDAAPGPVLTKPEKVRLRHG